MHDNEFAYVAFLRVHARAFLWCLDNCGIGDSGICILYVLHLLSVDSVISVSFSFLLMCVVSDIIIVVMHLRCRLYSSLH